MANMSTPYAWRSARSRNSQNSTVEEMEEKGRAPSFNARGQIDGFRSRPGAPMSPNDTLGGLTGISRPAGGGLSDRGAWGAFFGGNSPEGVRMGATATNPAIADAAFKFPSEEWRSKTLAKLQFMKRKDDIEKGGFYKVGEGFDETNIGDAESAIAEDRRLGPRSSDEFSAARPSAGGNGTSFMAGLKQRSAPSSFFSDPAGFATKDSDGGSYLGNVINSSMSFFKRRGIDPFGSGII